MSIRLLRNMSTTTSMSTSICSLFVRNSAVRQSINIRCAHRALNVGAIITAAMVQCGGKTTELTQKTGQLFFFRYGKMMVVIKKVILVLKVIAVSGYRSHELGIFSNKHEAVPYIQGVLKRRLIALIEEGLEWVVIGGQLGVELWTGEVVNELKDEFPNLKLAVLTPFQNQDDRWKEATQEYYQSVLANADFVESVSKRPYENPGQLQAHNQFIIEKTDGLLLFYDQDQQGSPEFYLKTALKYQEAGNEYPILSISFFDVNDYIEEVNQSDWAT